MKMTKQVEEVLEEYESDLKEISQRLLNGEDLRKIVPEYRIYREQEIRAIGVAHYLIEYIKRQTA
jgi:hypothetical protein